MATKAKNEVIIAEDCDIFTHEFKKPFEFEGETYTKLSFDFDSLTGKDISAISSELAKLRKISMASSANEEFIKRLATRLCTEKIGVDMLDALPARDYISITGKVRYFLLSLGV